MRYIPNFLTAARLLGAAVLLFCRPFSAAFFAVYLACGLTDALDGPLARRLQAESRAGALLDSLADFFFVAAVLGKLLPVLAWEPWMLWAVGAVAALRFLSLGIGALRFHTAAFLHTWGNKLTGAALFCAPLLWKLCGPAFAVAGLCALAGLSALEELVLLLTCRTLNRNVRGFWDKSRFHSR